MKAKVSFLLATWVTKALATDIDGTGGPQDIQRTVQQSQDLQDLVYLNTLADGVPNEVISSVSRSAQARDLDDEKRFGTLARKARKIKSLNVIGDSYSSGDGALQWGEGVCKRNKGSYGYRLNKLLEPESFKFLACSGAAVDKIITRQVESEAFGSPDLVLMTAGGDNGGAFFNVLMDCILLPGQRKCTKALNNAAKIAEAMPQSLGPLYEAIKSQKIIGAHPEIIHLGYVQMYNRDHDATHCPALPNDVSWPSTGKNGYREKINEVIRTINQKIKETARKHHVTYLDVDHLFEGHRLCDEKDSSWLQHKLTFTEDGVICHPSYEGHGAYITAVLHHLSK